MSNVASQEVQIINRLGLHARAAAKLTQTASRFKAKVWISHEQKKVNAKSIMGVMMLAASIGTKVNFNAEGEDADSAVAALVELVNDRFGEAD